MTTTQALALRDLTLWKGNVRKTSAAHAIEDFAASIKASGLIQSLAVIAHGRKFAVVAGGRRLAALQLLQAQGAIAADYIVACNVPPSLHYRLRRWFGMPTRRASRNWQSRASPRRSSRPQPRGDAGATQSRLDEAEASPTLDA
jgi:hypothetical protein